MWSGGVRLWAPELCTQLSMQCHNSQLTVMVRAGTDAPEQYWWFQ